MKLRASRGGTTRTGAPVRRGGRWAVSVDGEVMALARTRASATELARDAARILEGTTAMTLGPRGIIRADSADRGR